MPDILAYPPFPGIRQEGFDFLRQLKANNERDWFKPRKEVYEDELKGPMECLVADVARRLNEADFPLTGDPKKSRFRIYRDTRFSDDKTPYKTHVSAVFDRSGQKDENGVVYVHVEPGHTFLAAGFYHPSVKYLLPVRNAVVEDTGRFTRMLEAMQRNGLAVNSRGDTLTGMPRGFADYRDEPVAEYLRWKHYLVQRDVNDDAVNDPGFAEAVVQMAQDSMPLLQYVWSAHR